MAMVDSKQVGFLSLHAGSKLVTARQPDGSDKRHGMLFFGLSGTGMSTHSCHNRGPIRGILRDSIQWKVDHLIGTEAAKNEGGLDISEFDLSRYYTPKQI